VNIAVIGAGIAGTAAAHALARAGQHPTVFQKRAGSSELYSGALDFEPWEVSARTHEISENLAALARALGAWELPPSRRHVATADGNVRPADGRDRALLDLDACAGRRVGVVDLERDDWDAPLIAKSLAASRWARETRTEFVPVRVRALQNTFERRISAYDFARLHDAAERISALQVAIASVESKPDAWLFGPWLGFERAVADELSVSLGMPVGETCSAPGGIAGARFARARDRLLAEAATVRQAGVSKIEPRGRRYGLTSESGEMAEFSAVVLASGGVAAGGVALERSFERRGGTGFRLSFEAPVAIELDGEIVEGVSSLSNMDFVERGLSALLRVGIAADERGAVRGAPGLFVAGDACAGRPRTALFAALSGIRAAEQALRAARGEA